MKTKEARGLAASILIDVDAIITGTPRDEMERHTAAASAAVLATRLIGGLAINVARIAAALEEIADNTAPEEEETES